MLSSTRKENEIEKRLRTHDHDPRQFGNCMPIAWIELLEIISRIRVVNLWVFISNHLPFLAIK